MKKPSGSRKMPAYVRKPPRAPFVEHLQHRLNYRNLDCQTCRKGYEQGDLADQHGRTISRGGVPPEEFRCELCPLVRCPVTDTVSVVTLQVASMLALSPLTEHASLEFVFHVLEIPVPSRFATDVYERLALMAHVLREDERLRQAAK